MNKGKRAGSNIRGGDFLRVPLSELSNRAVFSAENIEKYRTYDSRELDNALEEAGLFTHQDLISRNTHKTAALLREGAAYKNAEAAIAMLGVLESELSTMVGSDEVLLNAVAVLTRYAFNAGFITGQASENSHQANLESSKGQALLAANEQNRDAATKKRLSIGEPTREAARELMRRKPWLSLSACATEIAGARDQKGIREMIKPLFRRDVGGRWQFAGDDPPETPG